MFDQILDTYRKATESTLKLQQDMLKSWSQQWPGMSSFPIPGAVFGSGAPGAIGAAFGAETIKEAHSKWAETITEMMNKHRETLDAEYRAGIRTIEDAFRVAEAKDPAQFRKLVEELWRNSFECLKTVAESQVRDMQAALQKGYEAATAGKK